MPLFPDTAEIRDPLLGFLQEAIGPCRYLEAPAPMTPGNDTQVHAFRLDAVDTPLVLRVFQQGSDPRRPVFEATLQNALADQGLAVPRALAICPDPSVIGAPFFVMERAAGKPLYGDVVHTDSAGVPQADWRAILRQGGDMLFDMPRLLAETCLRIHAVETKPVVSALEGVGFRPRQEFSVDGLLAQIRAQVDAGDLEGLRPAEAWLREHRPSVESPDVICHRDVQPLNLLAEASEPCTIIDWASTILAPREFEIGWTRAMYLTLELPLPGPIRLFEGPIGRLIAGRFTRVYSRGSTLHAEAVTYYETLRSIFSLSLLGEQRVRGEAIRDAWNSPGGIARLVAHVRERTGLGVSIPWSG